MEKCICFNCEHFNKCGQLDYVTKCRRFTTIKGWATDHTLKVTLKAKQRRKRKNIYLEKMGIETEKYYEFRCHHKESTSWGYQKNILAKNQKEAELKFYQDPANENLIVISIKEEML